MLLAEGLMVERSRPGHQTGLVKCPRFPAPDGVKPEQMKTLFGSHFKKIIDAELKFLVAGDASVNPLCGLWMKGITDVTKALITVGS